MKYCQIVAFHVIAAGNQQAARRQAVGKSPRGKLFGAVLEVG